MKRYFFLMLLLSIAYPRFSFGKTNDVVLTKVNINNVIFDSNGMFYFYSPAQNKIAIRQLSYKNGTYYALVDKNFFGVWFCPSCDHMNSRFDGACARCGEPRPDLKES